MRPEFEEDRQPPVVAPAPLHRFGDHALAPGDGVSLADGLLVVGHDPSGPPLIDREEEILLGLEVGVDRTLGVASLKSDLIHRRRVEALLGEEAPGRRDQLLTRALPSFSS